MELALTAAEMRAAEQAAIAAGRVTGRSMMETAGRGAVAALLALPGIGECRGKAVVLAGPGNNGGDGFVVARLLATCGWEVEVRLWGAPPAAPNRLSPDAGANAEAWAAMGGRVVAMAAAGPVPPGAVVVDAIFGTGLTRSLPDAVRGVLAGLADRTPGGGPRIALDAPSGLCLDSGRVLGEGAGACLGADLTVSFGAAKRGHYLAAGPDLCGWLAVVDLGIDLAGGGTPGPARLVAARPELLGKRGAAHKYDHGHALVLSGGVGHGGAARLAARAALRVGAGLVTLGCPPAALIENAARLDAVMLRGVADRAALEALVADPRINAVCLGPGLGTGARTRDLVGCLLGSPQPTPGRMLVLDADALTAFEGEVEALVSRLGPGCILTPHMGEFTRLFPDIAARLAGPPDRGPAFSRADAASAAAARAGALVLLKGADTVIAAPDGRVAIHGAVRERAAPWLATAGAGDVLAGLIAGLGARGLTPFDAACQAAWLHVEAARRAGPGLIAEDLPEAVPGVFRALAV